jgi:hypothetical protein
MNHTVDNPTHNTNKQCPDYRSPKTLNHKSFYNEGNEPEHGSVDDKGKKP